MPAVADSRLTVTLGTAGHIDHGKTALVHFLTGCNTDRLPEEQRRGMTIDLGFAPCRLEGERVVGIVDVPGHERFIRNMVAGATGIDAVILVVAADDGIMPQTREHFEVVRLLGVRHGLVALTKIDKAPEMVPLVTEQLREFLRGTFLEGAPILPVSAITGEGMWELRGEIERLVAGITPRSAQGAFRLPIENVFTLRGFGTVVTGIPVSGRVRVGDTLEILPGDLSGRVRGLQVYGETTTEGLAGECVAINLSDVPHERVRRGQVATTPGRFSPVRVLEARLHLLASAERPLPRSAAVKFHTGTSETPARLRLMEGLALAPGADALVQVALEQPAVVQPGDPFVVRSLSPVRTIGGGTVVGTSGRRRRRFDDDQVASVARSERAIGNTEARVENALRAGARTPVELARDTGASDEEVRAALAALSTAGRICRAARGEAWVHADTLQEAATRVMEALKVFHAENALRLGMERPALLRATGLSQPVLETALARLQSDQQVDRHGHLVALAGWQPGGTPQQQALIQAVEEAFRAGGFTPPAERDLGPVCRDETTRREIVTLLCQTGALVRTADDTIFHRDTVAQAQRLVAGHIAGQGEITVAAFRDLVKTSRRVAVSMLEHLDRLGITVRVGEARRLRPRQG